MRLHLGAIPRGTIVYFRASLQYVETNWSLNFGIGHNFSAGDK